MALPGLFISKEGKMIKAIKRFWERGRKGYCYEDLWSFDNFLSKLIANGLREFKQNCYSYPNDIDDWEEWMATLEEMIECFDEQCRGMENVDGDFMQRWHKRMDNKKQKLHRGLELLEKYYYDLWD